MSKKRPAASIASLEREIAKLKKENAELRGEDPKKKPRVGRNAKEAYVTCLLLGQEYPYRFEMDDFGANSTYELHASFRERLRDGKEVEFTLKGGKKVDLKKTFEQNEIEPNSLVYARYTGPAPWGDW